MPQNNMRETMKADEVLEKLLDKMKGQSWQKTWTSLASGQANHTTRKLYRGANQAILSLESADKGYTSGHWVTYKQAQELGGQVKKGEKGTQIVFFSVKERETETSEGTETEKFGFWKVYTVFALEQTTLPQLTVKTLPITSEKLNITVSGMEVIHNAGITTPHVKTSDFKVYMPLVEQFISKAEYLGTLFHEAIHWTGRPAGLNRECLQLYSQSIAYRAKEEVIAELGSCLLAARHNTGFTQTAENNASYIEGWLKSAKAKDLREYLSAAQKACDYVSERLTLSFGTQEQQTKDQKTVNF